MIKVPQETSTPAPSFFETLFFTVAPGYMVTEWPEKLLAMQMPPDLLVL